MKSNILASFIICCSWLMCNIGVADTPFYSPNALNNYSFISEQAYIIERSKNGSRILFVDFKNRSKKNLVNGEINSFSVSTNGKLLAYIENDDKNIIVINIASGKILYTGGRADQQFLQWSDTGNQLTFIDERNSKLYVVDFSDKLVEHFVKAQNYIQSYIIAVKWLRICHCFDYQFMPEDRPGLYGVFRIIDGKLVKRKETSVLVSPNGRYYLQPEDEFETANYISVYDTSTNKLLYKFDTLNPLMGRTGVIWKGNIVRMLGYPSGSIKLDTGKIISSRNGDLLAYDVLREHSPHNFDDLASDKQGYVLIWNREKKIFEVEDISTGKTIKTYKKFW